MVSAQAGGYPKLYSTGPVTVCSTVFLSRHPYARLFRDRPLQGKYGSQKAPYVLFITAHKQPLLSDSDTHTESGRAVSAGAYRHRAGGISSSPDTGTRIDYSIFINPATPIFLRSHTHELYKAERRRFEPKCGGESKRKK